MINEVHLKNKHISSIFTLHESDTKFTCMVISENITPDDSRELNKLISKFNRDLEKFEESINLTGTK